MKRISAWGTGRAKWMAALGALLIAGCGDDDGGNQNANLNQNLNPAQCGNGELEGSEECDEGALNSDVDPDACRTDCTLPRCGDGVRDAGEVCDEGRQNSNVVPDACREDCREPRCGDGVVDVVHGEGCDCGDGTGPLPGRCTLENSLDEQASCRPGCTPAGCGDGMLQGEELCDGTHLGDGDCTTFGFYAGTIGCTPACSYDLSGCSERCGDGLVNGEEICDGAAPEGPGQSCLLYGYDRGRLGCSEYCTPGFDDCGHVGWKLVPSGTSADLEGIFARSAVDIFVVGGEDTPTGRVGVIRHFDGEGWSAMPLPPGTPGLLGVQGFPDGSVFAVGYRGAVLEWDGTAWTRHAGLPDPFGQDLPGNRFNAIWGTSRQNVIVVGEETEGISGPGILRFDGTQWTQEAVGVLTYEPAAVWGSGADDVWVVGAGGEVLHFDGDAWSVVPIGTTSALTGVTGTGPHDIHVAGAYGSVHHFDGTTWTQIRAIDWFYLYDVATTADGHLFAVGMKQGGDVLYHDGASFARFATAAPAALRGVAALARDDVWAVGRGGLVVRFTGAAWAEMDYVPQAGNHQLRGIWGTAPDRIFVTGDGGHALQRWDGTAWTNPCPGLAAATGIWGLGSDVWVTEEYSGGGGPEGHVVRYDGVTCTTVFEDPEVGLLNGLWGSAAGDLHAVGEHGVLLQGTGTTWSTVAIAGIPVEEALYGVWIADDHGSGFAVGESGTIVRFDGSDWTAEAFPGNPSLLAVWGASDSDAYAVGTVGRILHWDGAAWTEVDSGTPYTLLAITGLPGGRVFAAGQQGALLVHDGQQWTPIRTPTTRDITGLLALGSSLYLVTAYEVHRLVVTGTL